MDRLGRRFADYRIVVFENDSRDGTLSALRAWQQESPRVTVLSESLGMPRWSHVPSGERAGQMASYRNRYLEYALKHHADYEYLIVVDLDVAGQWRNAGIADTFGRDGWDMVGSNGIQYQAHAGLPRYPVQFDAWAFREVGRETAHAYAEINPRRYPGDAPLVPLWSCFGGLGVYRMEVFRSGCRYAGGDCEHVLLHRAMRQRGFSRIFLNPRQVVVYPDLELE